MRPEEDRGRQGLRNDDGESNKEQDAKDGIKV